MTTLAINLTQIEFIVLPIVALIFGLAIYFFIRSRRTLRETLEAGKFYYPTLKKEKIQELLSQPLVVLEHPITRKRFETSHTNEEVIVPVKKQSSRIDEHMVKDLKQTIAQQQNMLNKYLDNIEELENEGRDELNKQNRLLQEEISKMQQELEKKDEQLEDVYQQAITAKKMASRIEEVYQEFDQLQSKMQMLEKQAGRANSFAIELEDTKNAYEVIYKELARKQEKLEEVMDDNRSMKEEINMLEDKLSEANLQRMQLQKKVQFLTDLNNDMQNISDTNKKLQTELRRIGELESMLTMMSEERDYLLRKKLEK